MADREGDIYDLYHESVIASEAKKADWLVRATKSRPITDQNGRKCKISTRKTEDIKLLVNIKVIFSENKGRYGALRIYHEMKEQVVKCGYKRVDRLMRENNTAAKVKKKFKVTTNSKHNYRVYPNLLEQNFTINAPNKIWTTDISYICTHEG